MNAKDFFEIYKALSDKSAEGFIIIDPDLHILFANPGAEKLLGYEADVLTHLYVKDIVEAHSMDLIITNINTAYERDNAGQRWIDADFVKKDSNVLPVKLVAYNHMHYSKGTIAMILFLDNTEQRESDKRINGVLLALKNLNQVNLRLWNVKKLQEGLDLILEAAITMMGAQKGIIQLFDDNKKALKIAAHKGFQQPFLDCLADAGKTNANACARALSELRPVIIEDVHKDEGAACNKEVSDESGFRAIIAARVYANNSKIAGVLSVYYKLPFCPSEEELQILELAASQTAALIDRIKFDQMQRRLNIECEKKVVERTLELTQSLERERINNELKSRFVSTASHEFRTPLAALLTSAEILEKYIGVNPESRVHKHINRIKSSVYHLNDILNDFLSLDKLENRPEEVLNTDFNLTDLVNETAKEMESVLKPGQYLRFDESEPFNVYQDKKIVRNIITNLVSNASKYSGEDETIEVNLTSQDNTVCLTVKDCGIGIPYEDQEFMFSRLFRASNAISVPGTGLGLSITKIYVELIGGTISFVSTPNIETIFTVKFPVAGKRGDFA